MENKTLRMIRDARIEDVPRMAQIINGYAKDGLMLPRSLSRIYWLNISDKSIPFVGAVEHTNFITAHHYGNRHVLYLSNYLPEGHRLYSLTPDELLNEYLPHIRRINPAFELNWVQDLWLFKDEAAQPVIERG